MSVSVNEVKPSYEELLFENQKLLRALSGLIPWVNTIADGPSWATAKGRANNLINCEAALANAESCFPEYYGWPMSQTNDSDNRAA